jgi:hypothetical protein
MSWVVMQDDNSFFALDHKKRIFRNFYQYYTEILKAVVLPFIRTCTVKAMQIYGFFVPETTYFEKTKFSHP